MQENNLTNEVTLLNHKLKSAEKEKGDIYERYREQEDFQK